MRIVKEHGERRAEILDTAEALLLSKGYSQTTVNDILAANNIAKGTFYHYFKSKEEVMDAVVDRFIDNEIAVAKAVAEDPSLTAHEKFFRVITGASRDTEHKDKMVAVTYEANNPKMHHKSLIATVLRLGPILSDIVKQGVEEGTFKTEYPNETMEILLVAFEFLLDPTIFPWESAELIEKAKKCSRIMETLLGVEKGSFSYVYDRYEETLQQRGGNE